MEGSRPKSGKGLYFPEKFLQPKDITLRSWINRYLDGCTNRGVENERRYGRRWSLLLGNQILTQITLEDLRRIQAKMKARAQWSDSTINRHFAFLRHVLMIAVRDGRLDRNPVSGLKFFPEARRTRHLTPAELMELQNVMSLTDWLLVAFAVETGLRREEQFRLRWDQVDMDNCILTIPLPKGGSTRHVPLSEGALGILRSMDSFLRSPWVFPSPTDPLQPWNPQSFVNHIFTPALRQAGIQGVSWHTLRHTAASRRVMEGVDLVSVKEILGHRDIQTTLRYAHLSPTHLRDAINRGSLFGTGSKTGTEQKQKEPAPTGAGSESLEGAEEKLWLGDQDSNLGSQIQSLTSYH